MEILNLNLIPTGANPVAHVSQYDEGRVIRFNLFEGSSVYTLDGTETIECDVKKPDGNVVTLAVTNTSSTYVEVTTTLQMCACSGESLGDIKITKGAVIIATLNFILDCERSPLENGIQSDSAIHNLEQQIADAVADQYDADSVIFDNMPTAGHGIGYAVTSDGLESYIPKDIADLDDVTTSAPTSGEALVWDGSKWTNGTPDLDLDDLGDVAVTTPTAGEIIEYDGAVWKNVANPASTTNFGAPYDENTTYNVPSLVIENNLLYKLNDGEDGTTGPFDPTKWTQTNVAELATLIGSLSTLTTSVKSSLVGAVNEVVSTKQAQINYITIADEAFTSSTSFAYTGKSVTCPVGHIYIVRARISYSNGAPQEIGASNSSTASDIYRCYARTDKACEIVFTLTGGETAYIWAKYASASSNTVRITAVDISV